MDNGCLLPAWEKSFSKRPVIEAENAFINFITNSNRTDKNYDEALYYLERIKFKTGEYYDETQIAENFIEKYPESPRSPMLLFELARYHELSARKTRAEDYYQVLMNNPLYAAFADSSAYLLADLYVSINSKDKAAAFLLGRAGEKRHTLSAQKMYYKLGSLYEEWERYDTAIAWYDSSVVINISPEISVDALYGIGRSFTEVNRYMDAEKTYKRIINEYPKNPYNFEIYEKLADLYFQQGLINKAIYASENSLKYARDDQKVDVLFFLADLYEEVHEDHALQLYTLIYNNTGNSMESRSEAMLKYADLSNRRGDRMAAMNAYTKVINDAPDSITVNRARNKLNLMNTDIKPEN